MKLLRLPVFLAAAAVTIMALPAVLHAAEGRIPIAGPTTISAPGAYIVTDDIAASSMHAIKVSANDVTIDLDGHLVAALTSGYWGIHADGFTNIRITNGRVRGAGGGIFLRKSGGSYHVEGVSITAGALSGNGLNVQGDATASAYAVVKNNIVTGLGNQTGIELYYAKGHIEGNKVAKWTVGIRLWFSSNVLVEKNIAAENSSVGIQLYDSAFYNVVKGNNVSQNGFAGISMFRADYNTIVSNTASGNTSHGIFLYSGINSADYNNLHRNTASCAAGGRGLYINGCGNIYSKNKTPGACDIFLSVDCTNIDGGGNTP